MVKLITRCPRISAAGSWVAMSAVARPMTRRSSVSSAPRARRGQGRPLARQAAAVADPVRQAPGDGEPAALAQADRSVEFAEPGAEAQRQARQPRPELGGIQGIARCPRRCQAGRARRYPDRGRQDGRVLRYPAQARALARRVSGPSRHDRPAVGGHQARHHPEQARFASAARAGKTQPLPGAYPQVDPVQHWTALPAAAGRPPQARPQTGARTAGPTRRRCTRRHACGGAGALPRRPRRAEPGQRLARGARVEIRRQPAQRQEHLGDDHQHREGLRQDRWPPNRAAGPAEQRPVRCLPPPGSRGPARSAGRIAASPAWQHAPPRPRRPRCARGHGPGRTREAARAPRPARRSGRRDARGRRADGVPRPRCPSRSAPASSGPTARASPARPPRAGPAGRSRPAAGPAPPGPGRRAAGLGRRMGRARRSRADKGRPRRPDRRSPLPARNSAGRRPADALGQRPPPGRARARRAAPSVQFSQAQPISPWPTASSTMSRLSAAAARAVRPPSSALESRRASRAACARKSTPGQRPPRPRRPARAWRPRRSAWRTPVTVSSRGDGGSRGSVPGARGRRRPRRPVWRPGQPLPEHPVAPALVQQHERNGDRRDDGHHHQGQVRRGGAPDGQREDRDRSRRGPGERAR